MMVDYTKEQQTHLNAINRRLRESQTSVATDIRLIPIYLSYGLGAILAAATAGAVFGSPYAVKLFRGSLHEGRIIGEDSGLEVATVTAFHTLRTANLILQKKRYDNHRNNNIG